MAGKKKTYEEAANRIDEILVILEKDEENLENMISLYKEGMDLVAHCNKEIEKAVLTVERYENNGSKKTDGE